MLGISRAKLRSKGFKVDDTANAKDNFLCESYGIELTNSLLTSDEGRNKPENSLNFIYLLPSLTIPTHLVNPDVITRASKLWFINCAGLYAY